MFTCKKWHMNNHCIKAKHRRNLIIARQTCKPKVTPVPICFLWTLCCDNVLYCYLSHVYILPPAIERYRFPPTTLALISSKVIICVHVFRLIFKKRKGTCTVSLITNLCLLKWFQTSCFRALSIDPQKWLTSWL